MIAKCQSPAVALPRVLIGVIFHQSGILLGFKNEMSNPSSLQSLSDINTLGFGHPAEITDRNFPYTALRRRSYPSRSSARSHIVGYRLDTLSSSPPATLPHLYRRIRYV